VLLKIDEMSTRFLDETVSPCLDNLNVLFHGTESSTAAFQGGFLPGSPLGMCDHVDHRWFCRLETRAFVGKFE